MTCEKVLIINQGKMVAYDEIEKLAPAARPGRARLARRDLHQAHRRLTATPEDSTMRNALAIARKELSIYFTTPWAYVGLHGDGGALVASSSSACWRRSSRCRRWRADARLGAAAAGLQRLPQPHRRRGGPAVGRGADHHALRRALPLHAAVRRGEAAEDLRAADDRAGAARGDRAGQVPGRPGRHLRHAGADASSSRCMLSVVRARASPARRWSGPRCCSATAGCCCGAPPAWRWGCSSPRSPRSQMLAALLTFAVLLPWMLLRGVAQTAEEPLRSSSATCPSTRSCRMMKGVLDVKALVFFAVRHPLLAAAHPPHGGSAALGVTMRERPMKPPPSEDSRRARAAAAAVQPLHLLPHPGSRGARRGQGGARALVLLAALLRHQLPAAGPVRPRRSTFFFASTALTRAGGAGRAGGVNYIAVQARTRRWDLTSKKIFTLAPQTSADARAGSRRRCTRWPHRRPPTRPTTTVEELFRRYHGEAPEKFDYAFKDPRREPGPGGEVPAQGGPDDGGARPRRGRRRAHTTLHVLSEQELTNALIKLNAVGEQKVYFLAATASGRWRRPRLRARPSGPLGAPQAAAPGGLRRRAAEPAWAGRRCPGTRALVVIAGAKTPYTAPEVEALRAVPAQGGRLLYFADANTTSRAGRCSWRSTAWRWTRAWPRTRSSTRATRYVLSRSSTASTSITRPLRERELQHRVPHRAQPHACCARASCRAA